MSDTAQDYQKLLSDVLQKQIIILGRQISLLKARKVPGLSVTNDGQVTAIAGDSREVMTQFLQSFRELSSPLVKKTMQPLLQVVIPDPVQKTNDDPSQTPVELKPLPDLQPTTPNNHLTEEQPERKEDSLVPKP